MKKLFCNILLILIVFTNCKHLSKNQEDTIDNLYTPVKNIVDKKKPLTSIDVDSIYLSETLTKALILAYKNIDNEVYRNHFVETIPDSSYQIEVDISKNFHFQKDTSHLIIKRNTPHTVYIDIFMNSNNKFNKILSIEEWALTFPNDSIYDINKDGYNDISINGYGVSGCCLKAFTNVYLFNHESNSFSEEFMFLNPTFSKNTRIIRGVNYGHQTYTSMYKYEWNFMTLDTIERVYYERNIDKELTGKVIIEDKNQKIIKKLKNIPNEYHSIFGYDWFTGEY